MAYKNEILSLPDIIKTDKRYMILKLRADCDHSVALHYRFYEKNCTEPSFFIRFGILPRVTTTVLIDRNWVNANDLYPGSLPGELKVVCHGHRVCWEDIVRAELSVLDSFEKTDISVVEAFFTDNYPSETEIEDIKLVDEFGQNKYKEWPEKVHSIDELKLSLSDHKSGFTGELQVSQYGGFLNIKLAEGTGFFAKYKMNNRWYLADPDGYAFFSMGPDCVNMASDCRVDGIEKWLDYLPDRNDPIYAPMYRQTSHGRPGTLFSYLQLNYYRVWGDNYIQNWEKDITGRLKALGMNTLANWSDRDLIFKQMMPYVYMLPKFPETKINIFRDFPDVFSKEYEISAGECAKNLISHKNDPYMIGYFLRNEPSWAFVDNLIIADEVLRNPELTASKEKLLLYLAEKYHNNILELNSAWNCDFKSFDDLKMSQIEKASDLSKDAQKDLKEFSLIMVKAYVEIPCKYCREADPNHMILGMRWAWISDPDLVAGWENFDVFSINCYAIDPTDAINHVAELGVDLPVMIGEFHFGALDAGPTATGLEGVKTQKDRGKAYSYYLERVASNPYGVGAHYFQCYDQFVLGRFDGENYNIGLFDVCGSPYADFAFHIKKTAARIPELLTGKIPPTDDIPETIPMIAY
ncbi:MAG: beta-galactosidase [Butyrivibrio sp.]|nr:beta-galactosidase [Butyrivibrio sp.]